MTRPSVAPVPRTASPAFASCSPSPSLLGVAYPLAGHGRRPGRRLPWQANGSLVTPTAAHRPTPADAVGSALIGQPFAGDELVPRPAVGGRRRLRHAGIGRLQPRPREPRPARRRSTERKAAVAGREGVAPEPRSRRTRSPRPRSGLDPHISPAYAVLQVARVARLAACRRRTYGRLVDEHTHGPDARRPR